jgi:ActR/RegA family two-component response regulator
MKFDPQSNHRILLIDDDESVHDVFRRILIRRSIRKAVPEEDADSSGCEPIPNKMPVFEIDSAFTGEEGLRLIEKSLLELRPYFMAFVDVCLGSGWDGVQTTCKIWQQYSDLQVVLCTGFSDRPWEDLVKSMGFLDRMIVLIKPFDITEVKQLAVGLSEKWRLGQQAKLRVDNLEKLVQNLRAR